MPYYAWRGVTLTAEIQKGVQFAASAQELQDLLFKRNIALLSYTPKRVLTVGPLSSQAKIDYFSHIHDLMKAGIRLPQALALVAQQTPQPRLAQQATTVAHAVAQGVPLHEVLQRMPWCSSIVKRLMQVGQESGSLAACLEILVNHLQTQARFKAQLRAALIVPLLTLAFFVAVLLILFTVVVPQFMLIFVSLQKPLPSSTQMLMSISNFLRSGSFLIVLMASGLIGVLLRGTQGGKRLATTLALKMPYIGTLIRYKEVASFLQAVAFLLKGGVPLSQAWYIASESITQPWFAVQVQEMGYELQAGRSLYEVMNRADHQLWLPDVVVFMRVGHESSTLPEMLEKGAALYETRLQRMLSTITTVIQPLLLIILGLLITGLIVALYSPIMSLSSAV